MKKESLQSERVVSRNGAGRSTLAEAHTVHANLVDKMLPLDGINSAVSLPAVNRPNGRILVVGHGQTAADVYDAIGGPHFNPFITLEFVGIHGRQKEMVETIIQGTSDVGITKNEVPMDLLKSGLTVFSPLKMRDGVPVRPEKPITLVARIKGSM
ncbi:MAG: hypothetical protein KA035_00645 [Candidatus Levybacteria bacterium]|nr:hypothetical protein [Candidatus Levybacteria bacterium]